VAVAPPGFASGMQNSPASRHCSWGGSASVVDRQLALAMRDKAGAASTSVNACYGSPAGASAHVDPGNSPRTRQKLSDLPRGAAIRGARSGPTHTEVIPRALAHRAVATVVESRLHARFDANGGALDRL
jgi:hypothetical protein